MRDEYDFTGATKNPYSAKLKAKKAVTIRIDDDSIEYFKNLSKDIGLPYQTLINLYLKDCIQNKRKISLNWS